EYAPASSALSRRANRARGGSRARVARRRARAHGAGLSSGRLQTHEQRDGERPQRTLEKARSTRVERSFFRGCPSPSSCVAIDGTRFALESWLPPLGAFPSAKEDRREEGSSHDWCSRRLGRRLSGGELRNAEFHGPRPTPGRNHLLHDGCL